MRMPNINEAPSDWSRQRRETRSLHFQKQKLVCRLLATHSAKVKGDSLSPLTRRHSHILHKLTLRTGSWDDLRFAVK
jgi:hypothetical protein